MSAALQALWYVLAGISVLVFLYGLARPLRAYSQGRRDELPPRGEMPGRLWRALVALYSHATISRRDRYVGWAHRAVFYGWVTLAAGTVIVGVSHDIAGPLFGAGFYDGGFYLACKAALNALGTALIVGLLMMMLRRAFGRTVKLDYRRPDRAPGEPGYDRRAYQVGDWVFVVSLLVIALTGYLLEGVRIAMEHPGFSGVQFGGWVAALLFRGSATATLGAWRHGIWWFHGLLAITVVAAVPYTKASHIVTSFVGLVLRNPEAGKRMPPIPESRAAEPAGYGAISDFSVAHLLQLDACTRCGRCHEACPALATGRPLSPRDVILELREQAHGRTSGSGPLDVLSVLSGNHGGGEEGKLGSARCDDQLSLIGRDGVRPETVWSCMQCNACVQACPVGVEQAPIIGQMRRRLLEEGEVEEGLQRTLRAIHKSGNSFGRSSKSRGSWVEGLDFEVPDARSEPVELLWFVGDYASFDPRSQRVTQSLARLLHQAGVSFGILYDGESNAGNDVRRVGEEGLYEMLAERNVATISACSFERVMTTDPHSLNSLVHEYPDFGGRWTVIHHTELLLELLERGGLTASRRLGHRVTFHDPCYLGRHVGVYEAPRQVLELLGCTVVEMPRNRANSFCCGAGGGQIWMAEPPGSERPSEVRIREATVLTDVDYFVVACPKDVTMFEDAIKTTENSDKISLRELTELVDVAVAQELLEVRP